MLYSIIFSAVLLVTAAVLSWDGARKGQDNE